MKPPQFTVRFLLGLCVVVAVLFGVGRIAFRRVYRAYIENFTYYTLEGPSSPDGYRVSVEVSDNSPGISTCFLADVEVHDTSGRVCASWFDHHGQYSAEGVRELVASMHWEDRHTLVFLTRSGLLTDRPERVVLIVSGAGRGIGTVPDPTGSSQGLPKPVKEVCVKRDGAVLKDQGKIVATLHRGDVLGAFGKRGKSLHVAQYRLGVKLRSGWVSEDDVVEGAAAFGYFSRAVVKDRRDSRAYYARACVHWHSLDGKAESVLGDLSAAIRLDPSFSEARFQRGAINLMVSPDPKRVIRDCSEILRVDPQATMAYRLRARGWVKAGHFEKALADYDKAIELDPDKTLFYEERAESRLLAGDYDAALADVFEARYRTGDAGRLKILEVRAWLGKNEYDRARNWLDKRIQGNPEGDWIAYTWRGHAWASQGEYGKALADFDKALSIYECSKVALSSRAWLRATCPEAGFRDGAKALRDAKAICRRRTWRNWQYLTTLAAAWAECGDFKNAVNCQKVAIERAPQRHSQSLETTLKLFEAGTPLRAR